MKRPAMLVSLRGMNQGFWSHFGCSGPNGRRSIFQGTLDEVTKKRSYFPFLRLGFSRSLD